MTTGSKDKSAHMSRHSRVSQLCRYVWQNQNQFPHPLACRYHLAANTQQDRREWLDALSAAIVQRSSAGASSSSEAAVAAAAALVTSGGAVRQPRRANGQSGLASGDATPGRSPMKEAENGASAVGLQVWRHRWQTSCNTVESPPMRLAKNRAVSQKMHRVLSTRCMLF